VKAAQLLYIILKKLVITDFLLLCGRSQPHIMWAGVANPLPYVREGNSEVIVIARGQEIMAVNSRSPRAQPEDKDLFTAIISWQPVL